MNMYKKYIIVFLFGVLVGAFFLGVFLTQKETARKSVARHLQKNAAEAENPKQRSGARRPVDEPEPAGLPDAGDQMHPTNLLNPIDLLEPAGSRQNTTNLRSRQPTNQQSTDSPEKVAEELIFASVYGALTRKLESDETTEAKPADNLSMVLDEEASLKDRQQAAWTLAKNADTEALLLLEEVLFGQDTPAALKAAIAEGLGYSSDPQGRELVLAALEDDDDLVVRGAIRGLSAIGDEEVIPMLSDILLSDDASSTVLAEAAIGLGRIDYPGAYKALVDAYHDITIAGNADLREDIVAALGQRDISETSQFFQQILDENTSSRSLRLATIEAVEDTQGNTTPFLSNNLYDEDSEVRAGVAWALAVADEPGDAAEELQALLVVEKNAEVRKRLYQALSNQENADIDGIAAVIFEETNLDARLAGYDFLAMHVASSENIDLREGFEQIVIPELQEVALTADKLSSRLSAVISLKRANTLESSLALEEVSAQSSDVRVVEAAGI